MKAILLSLLLILAGNGFSQDLIFTKNHDVLFTRIQDNQFGVITYKRWYLTDATLISVPVEDVVKIRYQDGKEVAFDSLTMEKAADTLDYAMIYFYYESGNDESQVFPLCINGQLVARLKNHMRLRLKVHSEGLLEIMRVLQGKPGPGVYLNTAHGNFYGISINVPNPQKLSPTDRFKLSVYSGQAGFSRFLNYEFNAFKPFKKNDLVMEEDMQKAYVTKNVTHDR